MNKTGVCYIFGAGEYYGSEEQVSADFSREKGDFLIAADGGLTRLLTLYLEPDLIIGDFDSLDDESASLVEQGVDLNNPDGPQFMKLPVAKDDTDTLAGMRIAYEKGYRVFHLFSCTGGRVDHTLANIQALSWLSERDAIGYLYDEEGVITVINGPDELVLDEHVAHPPKEDYIVSVFALNDAKVTYKGLKFPSEGEILTSIYPKGVSNRIVECPASVKVEEGSVIVYWED